MKGSKKVVEIIDIDPTTADVKVKEAISNFFGEEMVKKIISRSGGSSAQSTKR